MTPAGCCSHTYRAALPQRANRNEGDDMTEQLLKGFLR